MNFGDVKASLKNAWFKFHYLSLDVGLISFILSSSVCRIQKLEIETPVQVLLVLTVLIIYAIDHLIDSKYVEKNNPTVKQFFYLKYYNIIWGGVLIFTAINLLVLYFFIDKTLIFYGAILLMLVIIYLFVAYLRIGKRFYLKELFIALFFSMGILLPAFIQSLDLDLKLLVFIFLMAFYNLILIATNEARMDRLQGFPNLVNAVGQVNRKRIWLGLQVASLLITIILFYSSFEMVAVIGLTFIWLTLLLLDIFKAKFGNSDSFHQCCNLALAFPGIVFIF